MKPAIHTFALDEDEAAGRADAVLAAVRAAGAAPGDVIAALCGNGPTAIAARDAATLGDLVLAPINPRIAPAELAWLLAHARPRAVICDAAHADAARAAGATPIVPDADRWAAPIGGRHRSVGGTGATLLYTSGTTGRPKGCLRTAAQDGARAAELTATYGLNGDDVHLIACPLAHSAPGIFLRACRAVGARTVVQSGFEARAFLEAVAGHRATVCFLVPTQWQRLLALPEEVRAAADWSSLRCAIVAGAPIAAATKARILAWIGPRLWEFYGSSETGTVTVIGPDQHLARAGSVGRPPPGVSVRLLDERGAEVAPGALGEVFVRSPALMAGYRGDDGALTPAGDELSVGDLGRRDGDWLTLVDRKHDTIISGGVNVYPAAVERALAEHPRVAGAVAFGVDDPEWGQRVAAVIALHPGPPLTPDALVAFLRDHLAGPELPRLLAFCDLADLPIGGSGKALRRAARARFAAALAPI